MDIVQKMDLLCVERVPDSNFAEIDPVIYQDNRVINNMLKMEEFYIPSCNYFTDVQQDVQPFMRKIVTTWMLEVCEDQLCEDQVFPLAVNFMDRFLCRCAVSRQQLQLLGATTLLLASKIRQCQPLPVNLLCSYTDNSITPTELRNWELLVLSKLKWDVAAVTGFDYVDHIIERVPWGCESALVRRHSQTLIAICYTEPDLIRSPPSLIATACVCAAVRGLNIPSSERVMRDLCSLTRCDSDIAEYVVRFIEAVVDKETARASPTQPAPTPRTPQHPSTKQLPTTPSPVDDIFDDSRQPETPTDVQDIHF